MERRAGRESRAGGRTGAGCRRSRPARGSPRRCRRTTGRGGSPRCRKRPITSPWPSVFTSSPGITIRSRPARELDGFERAAEDVVVGDRDRAETFRLGVVDELGRIDRAVVRPRRVHVQVGDDPRPVGERLRLAAARAAGASRVTRTSRRAPRPRRRSSASPHAARAAAPSRSRSAASSASRAAAAAASSGCATTPCGRRSHSPRPPPRASPRRSPTMPGTKIAASSKSAARGSGVARGADVDPAGADRVGSQGVRSSGLRPQEHELPVGQLAQRAHAPSVRRRARSGAARATIVLSLRGRGEELGVDAGRDQLGSRPGSAPRPRRARPRRVAISASTRPSSFSRALAPADSRGGWPRRTSRPRARRRRAARGTRATAARARSRGRRRSRAASAWRRFACTPTGTPSCDRRETGIAAPTRSLRPRPLRERPPAGERSPAFVDGATHGHLVAAAAQLLGDAARRGR